MATALPTVDTPMVLGAIVHATGGTLHGDATLPLRGLATDTRTLHEGALFVALRGKRFDAHDHLDAAVRAGARALLVRRGATVPSGVPIVEVDDTLMALGMIAREHALRVRRAIPVVAISGAVGKTTTKELTAAAMAAAVEGPCHATRGNLNNLVGAPFTLLGLNEQHAALVVECGSNAAGEIARIGDMTRPHVAMCMNADIAHTEGLGSIDAVADEEGSLFAFASRAVVGNADDPRSRARMRRAREHVAHWLFGVSPEAHLRLVARDVLNDGRARLHFAVDARLCAGVDTLLVESALVGAAAATNIAAALCATAATGANAEALRRAARALNEVRAVPGRLHLRTLPSGVRVLDDTYNASPRAVRAALDAARELATRDGARLIVVLGDMLELGVLAAEEHARVGVLAAEAAVTLMAAVGPQMRAAADAARARGVAIECFDDASQAAPWLCGVVRAGDVVLVKGSRGMRMERCVAALDTLGASSR